MADEMLRIAGRSTDGLAKAIQTDNDGRIFSNIRGSLLANNYIYKEGNETVSWVIGYQEADTGTLSKLSSSMRLSVGKDAARDQISVVTDEKVDLTDVTAVEIDWEKSQNNHPYSEVYLIISDNKEFSSNNRTKYIQYANTFSRRAEVLDVNDLEGEYYIRIHARDASTDMNNTTIVDIYNLNLKTYSKKADIPIKMNDKGELVVATNAETTTESGGGSPSSLAVEDKEGNSVALTAELDDDDQAVLRVFDAAPHNQDPVTDSVKNVKQTKVRMDDVFNGTVDANGQETFSVKFENESKIWFHVEASEDGWKMMSGTIYKMTGNMYNTFFPTLHNDQAAYSSSAPKIVRWIGLTAGYPGAQLPEEIQNIHDAEAWAIPPGNHTIDFHVLNNSATPNEMNIRIVREWR